MIAKVLFKNPILMIGILMVTILLLTLNKKGMFFNRTELLKATSCNSVLVMLNKRTPETWTNKCRENNLEVNIESTLKPKQLKDPNTMKAVLYRELANNLIFISKNSLNESLERVLFVSVKINSQKMEINALTEGKYIAKLATMKNSKFISDHLKKTVKVKEIIK